MEKTILDKKSRSCEELLNEYRLGVNSRKKGELLCLTLGDKGYFCFGNDSEGEITIYNPTRPYERHGKKYLIGRVEPKDSEDSKVMFFEKKNDRWEIVPNAPVFHIQDPFIAENVQGWNIIGGVKIKLLKNGEIKFRTVFYKLKKCVSGELLNEKGGLKRPFAVGPEQMKDIRLVELKNGNVGVFTRPSGGKFGGGKIGFIEIKSLDELESAIPRAKIIEGQFCEGEWGGANELHLLNDGKIGVLGHIAHFDKDIRHYYAMSFVYDPVKNIASPIKILTTADQFPHVESKNKKLGKIIFSGGLVRKKDGTASLYTGVGDTRVGKINIPDPFLPYELSDA